MAKRTMWRRWWEENKNQRAERVLGKQGFLNHWSTAHVNSQRINQ